MNLHVAVTARHIANGKRGSCVKCPIALVIHELGYRQAVVRDRAVLPTHADDDPGNQNRRVIRLPNVAIKFIEEFDDGYFVEPIEFYIENWPDVAPIEHHRTRF